MANLNIGAVRSSGMRYQVGKILRTDFRSQTLDELQFTASNFTWTTEGGETCINPTANSAASFVTKEVFGDCIVRIRYKMADSGVHKPRLRTHYVDDNNMVECQENASNRYLNVKYNSTTTNITATRHPGTATLEDRHLSMQIVDGVATVHEWFDTEHAPATPILQGIIDNHPTRGQVGIYAPFDNYNIYELEIIELVRADDNLLYNSDFRLRDSNGVPLFWADEAGAVTGSTFGALFEETDGPFGDSVIAARLDFTGSQLYSGLTQSVYAADQQGVHPWNPAPQKISRRPAAMFGRTLECSVWTRSPSPGITIDGESPTSSVHAMLFNCRALGRVNTGDNPFTGTYYNQDLGPNRRRTVDQTVAGRGRGIWEDWYLTRWRWEIPNWRDISHCPFEIHSHDADLRGAIDICLPYVRVVG